MIIYGLNAVRETIATAPSNVEELFIATVGEEGETRGVARGGRGGRGKQASRGGRGGRGRRNRDDGGSGVGKRRTVENIVEIAERHKIKILYCDKRSLDNLTGTDSNQGIAARVGEFRYSGFEEIFDGARKAGNAASHTDGGLHRLVIVLDHIEDPQNLGAILRTAEFFGAMGAILPKARAAPITPSVIKTSSGAVSHLPIARTSNLVSAVDTLKAEGFWIAGADPVADTSVYDADFTNIDIALVIGNEGKGMSRLVKEKCDYLFAVPRTGEVESLNASAAAAVIISEIMRQWTRGVVGK